MFNPEFLDVVNFIDIQYSILFVLALSSLNVYSIVLSGWSSGTKYAYLGGLRSASQMISYEVAIGLTIIPIIYLTHSMKIADFIIGQVNNNPFVMINLSIFVIFVISQLAETNRAPFDLPEAEAELVAGYNVEYSSTAFALFFLGEYSNMLVASNLIPMLFIGTAWVVGQSLKAISTAFYLVLVRATYPRYRFNQLMKIGWQNFLPLTLAFFVYITGLA